MKLAALALVVACVAAHSHDHGSHSHSHSHSHDASDGHSDVFVLTGSNFAAYIAEKPVALVEFYAPWCGHCKRLAPEYEKAAHELVGVADLAKMDCTAEPNKAVCSKYEVSGYPTLKVFRSDGSAPIAYEAAREASAIVKFMTKQTQPAWKELKTQDQLTAFTATDLGMVGYFAKPSGPEYDAFISTVKELRNEYDFAVVTDPALFGDNQAPAAVLYKSFDEKIAKFSGAFTASNLKALLAAEAFPLVGDIGPENFSKYMDRKLPLFWLFLDLEAAETKNVLAAAAVAAAEYKGKVSFVKLDGIRWAQHAKTFGLTKTPGAVLQETKKNYVFSGEFTPENLSKHCKGVLEGTINPTLKSQEIPPPSKDAVVTLVGKNFEKVAFDDSKDVFVEFYAPWCGHCKNLAPKWDKLAEQLKADSNVIIAKLDATENDTPADITGFPTLIFYPANDKKGITYNGDRETDALAGFVAEKRATKPAAPAGHEDL